MSHDLPFSPACERNKSPITEALRNILSAEKAQFLELGFGTLQHAIHLCESFPQLTYYASDQKSYHPIFEANRSLKELPSNLYGPYVFEARADELILEAMSARKDELFDYIFSANTLHIMGWEEAQSLLNHIHSYLALEGELLIYGPFNFGGEYSSVSNERFDHSLKERNPKSGIRNFEDIVRLLKAKGISHVETKVMPANNHLLRFRRDA